MGDPIGIESINQFMETIVYDYKIAAIAWNDQTDQQKNKLLPAVVIQILPVRLLGKRTYCVTFCISSRVRDFCRLWEM